MAAAGLRPYAHDCRMLPLARLFTTAPSPSLTAGPPACSLCPLRTTTAWITSRRGWLRRSEHWLLPALHLLGWAVQQRRPGQLWWSEQACAWPSSLMQVGMGLGCCAVWLLGWVLCCVAGCGVGAVRCGMAAGLGARCACASAQHQQCLRHMPWQHALVSLVPHAPTSRQPTSRPPHLATQLQTTLRRGQPPSSGRASISLTQKTTAPRCLGSSCRRQGKQALTWQSFSSTGGWNSGWICRQRMGHWRLDCAGHVDQLVAMWRLVGLQHAADLCVCVCVQLTCRFGTVACPAQIRVQGPQLAVAALQGDPAPGARLCGSGGRHSVRPQVGGHGCCFCAVAATGGGEATQGLTAVE